MNTTTTIDPSGESAGADDDGSSSPASAGELDQPPPERTCDEHIVTILRADSVRGGVDVDRLARRLEDLLAHLPRKANRICVRLVGDDEMTDLHERHSNIAGTTDVLTFDATEPGGGIDADIAVCVDEAKRRAAERGHDCDREVLLYALHGMLHCCGYDDHDESDYQVMHAEEDRLLGLIGIAPTFDPSGGTSP